MKYSYNWLKELSGSKKSPEKLGDMLMMHSFEVESMESAGPSLDKVVVGEINHLEKHPDADRLQCVKVDVGIETLDIICGAWNIKVGDRVPVALVGSSLPCGIVVRPAEIRGIKSNGMLCAEDELGLGIDHAGILILKKQAKVGQKVAKYIGADDIAMDIKVLPNRGHDALSHVGMAREIVALEKKEIDFDYDGLKLSNKKSKKLSIEIKNANLCPRYIGAVLENIIIQPSPRWMQERLRACGIRPINSVVDATNYVMLELGQPLHAFDFEKISDIESQKSTRQLADKSLKASIVVRIAKKDEGIELLDESVKKLTADDLLITNRNKALAIAGVMGGKDSGIDEGTKTIVIEAANFNATSVRLTAARHNVRTDAAVQYEKDLDPNLAEKAMVRVVELLEKIAGAQLEGIVDVYPKKLKPWSIKLGVEVANKLLGIKLTASEIRLILASLGLSATIGKRKNELQVTIPTFRLDLKTPEDLIEEVGRIYGYDRIPSIAPLAHIYPAPINNRLQFGRQIKDLLVGNGFSETYAYSFYSQKLAENVGMGKFAHVEVTNPMNADQQLMRRSLIPGILTAARENLKRFSTMHLFELGKIYIPTAKSMPRENMMLVGAVVLNGDKIKAEEFFEAKGHCDSLFARLGIENYYYDTFEPLPIDEPSLVWHEGRSAAIKIEGQEEVVGYLGEIHPSVATKFDIEKRVAIFEIDATKLFELIESNHEYQPLRIYPTVTRDLALTVSRDNSARVDDILKSIQAVGGNDILDVDLFDIFELSDNQGTSFAFHIVFGADDRTLTNQEVDEAMKKIIQELESTLNLQVRK